MPNYHIHELVELEKGHVFLVQSSITSYNVVVWRDALKPVQLIAPGLDEVIDLSDDLLASLSQEARAVIAVIWFEDQNT